MTKQRLDNLLAQRGLVATRSQAESWIKLGKVTVDGKIVTKPGFFAREDAKVALKAKDRYVSRAGLKLASVATLLKLDFRNKTVLDVGSSTGGFTDYALQNGAKHVVAVDVGTNQLHPSLRGNEKVELYEKTDIRSVVCHSRPDRESSNNKLKNWIPSQAEDDRSKHNVLIQNCPDIVVIDVSFISLREILPHLFAQLSKPGTQVVAMVKPQFEAGRHQVNKGIIKNDTVRRQILKEFEVWAKQHAVLQDKADSDVTGSKGNRERFYLLSRGKTV